MHIQLALIFQNLSTEVKGGSFAATSAHMDVLQFGIEMANSGWRSTIHSQIYRPFAFFNFGDAELAGYTDWNVSRQDDYDKKAARFYSFGQSIQILRQGGIAFKKGEETKLRRWVSDQFDIKLPDTIEIGEPDAGTKAGDAQEAKQPGGPTSGNKPPEKLPRALLRALRVGLWGLPRSSGSDSARMIDVTCARPPHEAEASRPPSSREGQQRAVRAGEHLAIDSRYMQRGPQAFFWLFGPSVKQNERVGNVAIVHVRGPLEHHDDSWGENYEGLLRRFQDALSGEDSRKTIIEKHRIAKMWGDDPPDEDIPESATPPAAVVLCIDSPGGVVSGLNETVFAMQRAKRRAGIPVHVFANELAASAAYALSCVGDDITLPASAIVGSIGVISTMADQVGADEKTDSTSSRSRAAHARQTVTRTCASTTTQSRPSKSASISSPSSSSRS